MGCTLPDNESRSMVRTQLTSGSMPKQLRRFSGLMSLESGTFSATLPYADSWFSRLARPMDWSSARKDKRHNLRVGLRPDISLFFSRQPQLRFEFCRLFPNAHRATLTPSVGPSRWAGANLTAHSSVPSAHGGLTTRVRKVCIGLFSPLIGHSAKYHCRSMLSCPPI